MRKFYGFSNMVANRSDSSATMAIPEGGEIRKRLGKTK